LYAVVIWGMGGGSGGGASSSSSSSSGSSSHIIALLTAFEIYIEKLFVEFYNMCTKKLTSASILIHGIILGNEK